MSQLSLWFDRLLQAVTLVLMVGLAVVVLLGVAFRYSGNSLIWYDELAGVLLAWITFTGAALAMLRNAHLGFNGVLFGLPPAPRLLLFWLVEAIVILVLVVTAWAGWAILEVFGNETLTSLRFAKRSVVQSILPIGALLMIAGRLLILPQRLANVRAGKDPEMVEIEEEIARAKAEANQRQERTAP